MDEKYGEILGAHMIGPEVTELLPELTLAHMMELTPHEIARNVHAHPTLSEVLMEAAHGARTPDTYIEIKTQTSEVLKLRKFFSGTFSIKSQIPPGLPKSERDLLQGECNAYYIRRDKRNLSKA